MSEPVLRIEREENIAIVTLNRPDKMNALNADLNAQIPAAMEELEKDESVRVIILTGAGRAFCSGADVGEQKKKTGGSMKPADRAGFLRMVGDIILSFEKTSKPIIAAVNGVAAGVGLTMSLVCDIRIAADTARFAAVWVKRGFIPDGGATFLLPSIVGMDKALLLSYTGDIIDAAEAERMGLTTLVVPAADLILEAKSLAKRIAARPPLTVGLIKNLMWQDVRSQIRKALVVEGYGQNLARTTDDHKEAINAFLEKRDPQFVGR